MDKEELTSEQWEEADANEGDPTDKQEDSKSTNNPTLKLPTGAGNRDVKTPRSPSPARLSGAIAGRIGSQMDRMELLDDTLSSIGEALKTRPPQSYIQQLRTQVQEIYAEFLIDHNILINTWPTSNLNHAYFKDKIYLKTTNLKNNANLLLTKLLEQAPQREIDQDSEGSRKGSSSVQLPKINLPKFHGSYQQWTAFSELFTSLVLQETSLTDVQKMHYLKTSLEGEPERLISGLKISGDSLKAAWETLVSRYEDKRLIIQSYLERLFELKPCSMPNRKELNKIYNTVAESAKALQALAEQRPLGDFFLSHIMTRCLDRSMRQDLEFSLGQSREFPNYADVEEFVRKKLRAMEISESKPAPAQLNTSGTSRSSTSKPVSAHQASSAGTTAQKYAPAQHTGYSCDCCQGSHYIVACTTFRNLTPQERRTMITTKRLCYNCLGRHSAKACKSTMLCRTCSSKHHTLLHDVSPHISATSTTPQSATPRTPPTTSALALNKGTLLATAVAVTHTSTSSHRLRLLIDTGSEFSFISQEKVKELHLQRQPASLPVSGIGGMLSTQTRGCVTLKIKSMYSSDYITARLYVLNRLSTSLPSVEVNTSSLAHLQALQLADPEFHRSRPIDVLLGADVYGSVVRPEIIKFSPSSPVAQLSIFGWLLLGPITSAEYRGHASAFHTTVQLDNQTLQEFLTRFWEQEEVPMKPPEMLSPENQECEQHFLSTHSRDKEGRYIVRIPLKEPLSLLGESYLTAQQSLVRMLRRLAKNDTLRELYDTFMKEYEDLGHMVRAPIASRRSEDERAYYLPHHGVLKPESTTTKLRVVFNGSSPSSSGHSINDLTHTGANLLLNIADVLTWIRQHRVLFSTDVTKMYRQIKVHEKDWNLQRILWVDEHRAIVPYQLTTVTYGTKSAPFLAVRALLQLATDEGHRFPLAVPSIIHGRYVDDIFGGADTEEELLEVAQQLNQLCNAGGFPLAKWHATSVELLSQLNTSGHLETTIDFDDCATKILGLHWSPREDKFVFVYNSPARPSVLTKRSVLSEVAQIFDPLGFISPVTIKAKILLQELWLHKVGWDDPLPTAISKRWLKMKEDFTKLANISIPRWFNTCKGSRVQLHGFSDASKLATAAVVYFTVWTAPEEKMTSLVCSKTKVTPLKRLTTPKLELSAAHLLAKLVNHVKATTKFNIESTFLWTDSKTTLAWINTHPSRWMDYVQNRVSQIQDLTKDAQWNHVPGTCNPADCASRGITTAQLAERPLWWTGPPWLNQPETSWPAKMDTSGDLCEEELRPGISLVGVLPGRDHHWDLIYRYSSLFKLVRVTALCFRIRDKVKKRLADPPVRTISSQDLRRAQLFWVKATQALFFPDEIKTLSERKPLSPTHPLSRLTAFVDADGILRVGGRLSLSPLSEETKHPAILPRDAPLTSLIIHEAHHRTMHGGTQLTLAQVRQQYWILGGRAPVKAHVLRCVVCARQRGIRAHQLMGQLPLSRVTPSRSFSHTGVDYAGPLTLKTTQGRGAKTHKGWICVFVCLTTSAVYLDAVTDYSSDSFLAAYRRFSARRGIPSVMYSDCGTTFVGADKALKQLFKESSRQHQDIAMTLSKDSTEWRFNPPAAPHMGGKWEAAVKSVKHHLRRIVGEQLHTFEQISTFLSQIEAILNSRPLEPLSDDPEDVAALTPGHFLTGSALTTIPEPSLLDIRSSRLSHWQAIQQRVQQFWKIWSSQYLLQLQAISKWHHPQHQLKVGALVLIVDERFAPCKWPLARVVSLHRGQDGLPRSATLKTATTTIDRPVVKLALLPIPTPDATEYNHLR